MYDENGELWAAYYDGASLSYYTNVKSDVRIPVHYKNKIKTKGRFLCIYQKQKNRLFMYRIGFTRGVKAYVGLIEVLKTKNE